MWKYGLKCLSHEQRFTKDQCFFDLGNCRKSCDHQSEHTWKKENSGHVRCGSELVSLESTYNPGYTSHKSNLNFQNGGSSTSQGKTWIRLEEDKQIDLKSYSVSPAWESQKECNKSNSLYSPSVSYHRRGDTSDISVPILDHLVNQLRSQQIKGHRVDPSANQMQV